MKKSFTLKAFAFGAAAAVALSASATPHEFLKVENKPMAVKIDINETPAIVKNLKINNSSAAKAPAKKAAANYGEWAAAGEGVYSFTQMLSRTVKEKYNYERRDDSANAGDFQVKIIDWGKDIIFETSKGEEPIDLVMTVTKNADGSYYPHLEANGIPMGFDAQYTDENNQTKTAPVYKYDYISWLRALKANGEQITEENIQSWASLFSYSEETGLIDYLPVYALVIDGKPSWFAMATANKDASGNIIDYKTESFRFIGSNYKNYDFEVDETTSYFNHEKDATKGWFSINYNMNDNAQVAFRILTGRKTGTTLQNALKTLVNDLGADQLPDDIYVTETAEGTAKVPILDYKARQYTLIAAYTNGKPDAEGYVSYSGYADNTLRLTSDALNYYDAGTAVYTDGFMSEVMEYVFDEDDLAALGLPETYTVTVPVQANSKVEGEYRLVYPYALYHQDILKGNLNYDKSYDFLTFNVADNSKSFINKSTTGLYYSTKTSEVIVSVGSTNKFAGTNTAAANVWGTYANGELTFPTTNLQGVSDIDNLVSALSFSFTIKSDNSDMMVIPTLFAQNTKIEAALAGVENVAADAEFDANAPVEYFNLQGIRVAAPEAGQLLIKVQGKKAEKVVIR